MILFIYLLTYSLNALSLVIDFTKFFLVKQRQQTHPCIRLTVKS